MLAVKKNRPTQKSGAVIHVLPSFPRKRESTKQTIRLEQIRTGDRQRLIKRLGVIDCGTLAKVNRAIQISLGLTEV